MSPHYGLRVVIRVAAVGTAFPAVFAQEAFVEGKTVSWLPLNTPASKLPRQEPPLCPWKEVNIYWGTARVHTDEIALGTKCAISRCGKWTPPSRQICLLQPNSRTHMIGHYKVSSQFQGRVLEVYGAAHLSSTLIFNDKSVEGLKAVTSRVDEVAGEELKGATDLADIFLRRPQM